MSISVRTRLGDEDFGAPAASTLTLVKPASTVATDIMVAFIGSQALSGSVGTYTAPAGWTAIGSPVAQGQINLAVWWSLGSNTNFGFTKSGNVDYAGWLTDSFIGCDNTSPVDVVGTPTSNGGLTTLVTSSLSIATAGSWHIIAVTDVLAGFQSASGFTFRSNGGGTQGCGILYNTTPKSVGSTGTVTVTDDTSGGSQAIICKSFALRVPVAGGPSAGQQSSMFLGAA